MNVGQIVFTSYLNVSDVSSDLLSFHLPWSWFLLAQARLGGG